MATAFVQEFAIDAGDTSTANYDAVAGEIGRAAPEGLIVHTAGFDHDRGVFRIVDVWESREAGQRFMDEKLMPILERMAAERPAEDFRPPDVESWYELHDMLK